MKMTNLVQGSKDFPYHVSIGAVLVNSEGKVCVHHFGKINFAGREADDFYILMRETPEGGESPLDTLSRGLREEFGATASVRHYLGSIVCDPNLPYNREKTTLYFLCDVVSQDISKRENTDIEFESILEWHELDFLIERMKRQAKKTGFGDIDESKMLERTKQYISL
jgi:hypothetical protein